MDDWTSATFGKLSRKQTCCISCMYCFMYTASNICFPPIVLNLVCGYHMLTERSLRAVCKQKQLRPRNVEIMLIKK